MPGNPGAGWNGNGGSPTGAGGGASEGVKPTSGGTRLAGGEGWKGFRGNIEGGGLWSGLGGIDNGGGRNGFRGIKEGGRNGFGGNRNPKPACGDGRSGTSNVVKGSDVDFDFSDVSVSFFGKFGNPGSGGRGRGRGRGGSCGSGGSLGSSGRGGKMFWLVGGWYGIGVGSWVWGGTGNIGETTGKRAKAFLELNSLDLRRLGFWLHSAGSFRGLKVKNPAEKMWIPFFLDLRWSEYEVAVDATEQ